VLRSITVLTPANQRYYSHTHCTQHMSVSTTLNSKLDLKPDDARRYLHPLAILRRVIGTCNSEDERQCDELVRVADFFYGSILPGALALLDDARSIVQIRSLFLVQSLSLNKQQQRGGSNGGGAYLCVLDDTLCHCSCRSFFERSRAAASGQALCKHLLALLLVQPLTAGRAMTKLEFATEEEYQNEILRRLQIDY
jgi:hypothetical protein